MLARDQSGVVYVEFLIVFVPIFVFFLVIMQFALLFVSDLGVRHAASAATRSAIVVLDDDPARYGNQARRDLKGGGSCSSGGGSKLFSALAQAAGSGGVQTNQEASCQGGPRAQAIRSAAVAAMLPFSPPLQHLLGLGGTGGGSALGAVGGIVGKIFYGLGATAIAFPSRPGSAQARSSWQPGEMVTVRVTYLSYCAIPLASLLICDRMVSLRSGMDFELLERHSWTERQEVWSRLRAAQPAVGELFDGSSQPSLLSGLMLSGARFKLLQAEASMPLQGADYPYQSELE
jgi:hypothetical protein